MAEDKSQDGAKALVLDVAVQVMQDAINREPDNLLKQGMKSALETIRTSLSPQGEENHNNISEITGETCSCYGCVTQRKSCEQGLNHLMGEKVEILTDGIIDAEMSSVERAIQYLEELREIYVGAEGVVPETAPEAYQNKVMKEMYDAAMLAKKFLTRPAALQSQPAAVVDWYERSHANHMEFIKRANAKGKLLTETEICDFLVLAIAGESGELANLHKKAWRGDVIDAVKNEDEAADIYIYLKHYAYHKGFDLDKAAARKVAIVTERLKAAIQGDE